MQSYLRGVVYAVLAGVCLSGAGLVVRQIEAADAWQVLFYRSLSFFFTVVVFIAVRNRGTVIPSFRALRPVDYLASVALAAGFIFYVLSLFNTLVANTVLMLSTGPFMTAVLGLLVLRERVHKRTWAAMAVAIAGVLVMVSGSLGVDDIKGYVYAFLAVLSFSVMVVVLRAAGQRDVIAATALAGLLAALFCVPFVQSYSISGWDILLSCFMGSAQIGLGFILITLASRSVPAAQVPLLALSETALAPIWVWWFVNEVPHALTLLGGCIILLAVIYQGMAVELRGGNHNAT